MPDCAEQVFGDVGGTSWSSLDALRSCVGNVGRDEDNAMLDARRVAKLVDLGLVKFIDGRRDASVCGTLQSGRRRQRASTGLRE